MNKNKIIKFVCAAAVLAAGLNGCATAQQSPTQQTDMATITTGTNVHVGIFYATAKMTNGTGTFYITPPAGTQTGAFSDISGFPSPYSSSLVVTRKSDQFNWFTNNNTVTFPATNSSYSLTAYVTSLTPPPTNGQKLTLQIQWNTNSP